MHEHHVVAHRRLGVGENLAGQRPLLAHQQLVEEEVHQVHVARIANGLVVDVGDATLIGLAHRAQPARRGERLQLGAVDVERLAPLHRRDPLAHALLQHLAVVEVLVDHALRRPVERIPQQTRRVLRQRADAHPHRAAHVEGLDLRGGDDGDEARGEPALRCHQTLRRRAQLDDRLRGAHVFGEVEVVDAQRMGDRGDRPIEVIRQARQHGLGPPSSARSADESAMSHARTANGVSDRGLRWSMPITSKPAS